MLNPPTSLARRYLIAILLSFTSCAQQFTVSINDQAVYDPLGRLISGQVTDSDLQGCINLALQQQNLQDAAELNVLACANSQIVNLENISLLKQLRFLDLANNNISNITPLEGLTQLGGVNLTNNVITDVTPLLNIASLASVGLLGNDQIPCTQLDLLVTKLGANLTPPVSCKN